SVETYLRPGLVLHDRPTQEKTRGRSREAAARAERRPPSGDSQSRRAGRPAREQRVQGRTRAAAIRAGATRPAPPTTEQAVANRRLTNSGRQGRARLARRRSGQKTGERETYSLVFGDSVEFEEGHVSMSSPIGRTLVGRSVGETVVLKLPAMTRRLKILELKTIHDAA